MRISEMQRREDFHQVLCRTLAIGWSEQYGKPVEVLPPEATGGRLWCMQPLLSACYRPSLNRNVRHFLRDSFRFTPITWRIPAQWVLGTLISTSFGLRSTGLPAFRVSTDLPNEDSLLVVPGNQRIRVFDFERRVCRVFLKEGFSTHTIRREIEVRGEGDKGPFPKLTAWDLKANWFEEPIVPGVSLPRCPAWYDKSHFEHMALDLLDNWLDRSVLRLPVEIRLGELSDQLTRHVELVAHRYDGFDPLPVLRWLKTLVRVASALESIEVAETHGDFQPGNILVDTSSDSVVLIDWEHCRRRWRYYDHFVYGLRTRSSVGLATRLVEFRDGVTVLPFIPRQHVSLGVLGLFILEDLNWFLEESLNGPFLVPSEGLTSYCSELNTLGLNLERLFPEG